MPTKITVKNGKCKFRAAGKAQAVHFALASAGKTVLIFNDGETKEIIRYQDGKRVKTTTVPVEG